MIKYFVLSMLATLSFMPSFSEAQSSQRELDRERFLQDRLREKGLVPAEKDGASRPKLVFPKPSEVKESPKPYVGAPRTLPGANAAVEEPPKVHRSPNFSDRGKAALAAESAEKAPPSSPASAEPGEASSSPEEAVVEVEGSSSGENSFETALALDFHKEKLLGAYEMFMFVQGCYEARRNYQSKYIDDSTMRVARTQIKTIERDATFSAPGIDTKQVWSDASLKYQANFGQMIGLAKMAPHVLHQELVFLCRGAVSELGGSSNEAPKKNF